jgi:HD-GYP domain-containing protein (c-di-GMP phosphodiesterase class II)
MYSFVDMHPTPESSRPVEPTHIPLNVLSGVSYASKSLEVLNLTEDQHAFNRTVQADVSHDPVVQHLVNGLAEQVNWKAEHSERVGIGVGALAIVAKESYDSVRLAVVAARLHDIGWMHPLLKPIVNFGGPLDEEGKALAKQHADFGMGIVEDAGLDDNVRQLVGCVHTMRAQDPYPANFKFSEALPFIGVKDGEVPNLERLGMILGGIWDPYDAGRSSRPYSQIETREVALSYLVKNYTGDPELLEQFEELTRPAAGDQDRDAALSN